ncbi:MAG TPA: GNAT family N-acetyltransferase [Sphingomicrobium sp.]|mgnify:CR=1 FL=1|nr:GNAT family N-acetyltransferase [Sphingomicrobium sp.]
MLVRRAQSQQDFDAVARLMRAFVEWHYERHAGDRHLIDGYFDPVKFELELGSLPGEYAPPNGELLVAEEDGAIVGCVALRPLADGTCEMKRMFVFSRHHGKGVGMILGQAIVEAARRIGYRRMVLDTGPRQREAQGLYHRLGFKNVAPYYDIAPDLREWLVFMELDLAP